MTTKRYMNIFCLLQKSGVFCPLVFPYAGKNRVESSGMNRNPGQEDRLIDDNEGVV